LIQVEGYRFLTILTIIFAGVAFYFFTGCEDKIKELSLEEMGYDFFPLETGSFREYRVRKIDYPVLGDPDTLHYFLKEIVADSFINQTGDITYILERYSKESDTSAWDINAAWTASKSNTNVVVVENNIPYVKMTFPVLEGKRWDGNAFNIMSEELYTFEETFQSRDIEGENYESTLKIVHQNNPDSVVTTDIRNEIYALNIGLIYKESIILHYCTDNECLGNMIIEEGMDYRQALIGYGNE
jgi:hypothetical protein